MLQWNTMYQMKDEIIQFLGRMQVELKGIIISQWKNGKCQIIFLLKPELRWDGKSAKL